MFLLTSIVLFLFVCYDRLLVSLSHKYMLSAMVYLKPKLLNFPSVYIWKVTNKQMVTHAKNEYLVSDYQS